MSELPSWMDGQGVDQSMDDPNNPGASGDGPILNGRFYLKKGQSATVIFLTDGSGEYGPPGIFEHNPIYGEGPSRWTHYFTCLAPTGKTCPLCTWAAKNKGTARRYKALFFTILDLTEYEKRDGTKVRKGKALFCAKKDTAEIVARKYLSRIEAGASLRGAMFKIHRGSDSTSSKVGNDFEFIKMVDLSEYSDTTQLDYRTLLAPNEEELQKAVERLQYENSGGVAGVPSDIEGSGPATSLGNDDDIPF